jgi:argininosuccinate lyase
VPRPAACVQQGHAEDKQAIFEASKRAGLWASGVFPDARDDANIRRKFRNAAAKGFINATDCADYLAKKGIPFRDAYRITGQLVRLCAEKGCTLGQLPLEDYKNLCAAFDGDIYAAIDVLTCVEQRNVRGGPAPQAVAAQIARIRQALAQED